MFHSRSLKLAGLYLGIIMCISLFFSLGVYQLSVRELDRGIRGPHPAFDMGPGSALPSQTRQALEQDATQRSVTAKDHVRNELVVINIVIFFGAGLLSYYLALRTLRPIEAAHEAQSRFTADASHELRTPISVMRSEIEVALMDPKLKLGQAKDLLRSNLEELDKLTALSSGLLKLAQNEYGTIEMADVDLAEAVSQAVSRVKPKAKDKHIAINQQLSNKVLIHADAESVVDLFATILDNAVKYSPDKTTIDISAEIQRKRAVIRIKDEGIGMLASDSQHIFDRFYRADSARSKQQANGYGIGLSIAKQIADVHHGTIAVQSEPDKGSTFSISLPLAS